MIHGVHQLGHVEDAGVVDQTGPRPVPLPGDQIDHIAAVGGAERAGAVAVDEGVRGQGGGPALLQVLQRPVAPVVVDGVGEGLAVAGRAVEIDHDHGVSGRGVDLRVPAIGPALGPGRLGPAVDQIDGRIGPALDIADRLEHPALHELVVPAREVETFGVGQVQRGHRRRVLGRERPPRTRRRAHRHRGRAAGRSLRSPTTRTPCASSIMVIEPEPLSASRSPVRASIS